MYEVIKLKVIESPYDSLALSEEVPNLFMQALLLKLNSYQNVYPYGVMPADTYDFICTHHIVGLETGETFRPLMVYRMVTAEKCELHRVPFPGLLALRGPGAETHRAVLEKLLTKWKGAGERVSFGSSWAITPELRADRGLRNVLKDMMTAMLVHHETESRTTHLIAAGMVGVHTDAYFRNIGYIAMENDGMPLPAFAHASLMGAEAILMHATAFNEKARALAEKYRGHWEARQVFALPALTEKKRVA
jgi:hypothetical protein